MGWQNLTPPRSSTAMVSGWSRVHGSSRLFQSWSPGALEMIHIDVCLEKLSLDPGDMRPLIVSRVRKKKSRLAAH